MRRDDICLFLGPADRAELQALITDHNTPRKLVWRAEIVLATADGHGTFEIMRRDHAAGEHVETHGLALAGKVSQRRCEWPEARQDLAVVCAATTK